MKAMILAAGRGERLRPLTDTCPKPLIEIGGRALIDWTIERLAAAGFRDLVVNLSWLGEQLRAALGDGRRWGVRLRYSPEPDVALETGGGIHAALPLLGDGPFAVVNGDLWTDFDFARLRQPLDSQLAHLVLVDNPAHHPRGDFTLDHGRVSTGSARRLTFSGIGVYRAQLFAGCSAGRFALAPLLVRAMHHAQVSGEHFRGRWFDTGSPRRLAAARAAVEAETRPDAIPPQP